MITCQQLVIVYRKSRPTRHCTGGECRPQPTEGTVVRSSEREHDGSRCREHDLVLAPIPPRAGQEERDGPIPDVEPAVAADKAGGVHLGTLEAHGWRERRCIIGHRRRLRS